MYVNQPMLLGNRKTAFTASLRKYASQQTIIFDHVITNERNMYSPITGVFTAPHLYHNCHEPLLKLKQR